MDAATYSEFSTGIHRSGARQRAPLDGTIEVTHRCPLTCSHCYNNLPMGDARARRGELSLEEHCRILDEIADAGCLWLLFTGGEIFARPDFLEIFTHAKRKGLLITLFTNGTLISPRVADYLALNRPFSIEITLYGATRATYERLTGVSGSYDRCMNGIRLLLERDLPLSLKTVAVTVNQHEVWQMKRLAEEELGVNFKFDAMMSPRIDCSQSPLAVRLRPHEVVGFDLDDPERVSEWRRVAEQFGSLARTPAEREQVYHCGGGLNAFAIDPYGRMSICVLSHQDVYDLRRGSFREGWEHYLHRVRQKKISRMTKCTRCELKAMCGMCPANGELENGDKESPVDFLCHVAHLRARAFGLPVPPHGDCEYCEGGDRHGALLQSMSLLENRPVSSGSSARREPMLLPMLAAAAAGRAGGCSTGGCVGCGIAAGVD